METPAASQPYLTLHFHGSMGPYMQTLKMTNGFVEQLGSTILASTWVTSLRLLRTPTPGRWEWEKVQTAKSGLRREHRGAARRFSYSSLLEKRLSYTRRAGLALAARPTLPWQLSMLVPPRVDNESSEASGLPCGQPPQAPVLVGRFIVTPSSGPVSSGMSSLLYVLAPFLCIEDDILV